MATLLYITDLVRLAKAVKKTFSKYDDTFGYRTEKFNKIKICLEHFDARSEIDENEALNEAIWYLLGMMDPHNKAEALRYLEDTQTHKRIINLIFLEMLPTNHPLPHKLIKKPKTITKSTP
jgi:hypothetical protein